MREILELRVNYNFAYLLFDNKEGKDLDTSVKIVQISKDDPRFNKIPLIAKDVKQKYNEGFYYGWNIIYKYNSSELELASLFKINVKKYFEPAGEECGTIYDESVACEICGSNRKQIGHLRLKKSSIPKTDIAETIGGEVVVSEQFVNSYNRRNLKGAIFNPINFGKGISNYYQLIAENELDLSDKTLAGCNPFDLTMESSEAREFEICGYKEKFDTEIYKCPKGHLIGLNLLSEVHVFNNSCIKELDFFASKQKIGVKRGLLRPEPVYLCSPEFRKMIIEEKLKGFGFEVAHIDED